MCGIIGVLNRDTRPVDFGILGRMAAAQRHRGPDDSGFAGFSFGQNRVTPVEEPLDGTHAGFSGGLGFNRLSIVDLSHNGHQPMISDDGRIAIAYNGETYNAFSFRESLIRKGRHFRSGTDTEVLLHLYQEYGIDRMLEMISGMFAFCIVDLAKGRMFLARDHAGIKPMYWCKAGDSLLFASEVKSLLQHPAFAPELETAHLDEYLLFNYNGHDRTLFKGVQRVPPGHYLEIDANGERTVEYWRPRLDDRLQLSGNEAMDALEHVFKASVGSHLMSDVRLGCQLSGGIDSSMITTYATSFMGHDLDTFSIGFDNPLYCEDHYIDQVLAKTGARPHRYVVDREHFARNLHAAAWHMDEPLPIPQCVGFKRIASGAADHVTVLLSGEGSDELMGGYQFLYYLACRQCHPLWLRLHAMLPKNGRKTARRFMTDLPIGRYLLVHREGERIPHWQQLRPRADLDDLLDQREPMVPRDGDLLKSARVYCMRGWLAHLLNIQDKMAMAHSIENRVPIIDRSMIDFAFSLPGDRFLRASPNPLRKNDPNRNTKILLKQLAARTYGDAFAWRDKIGFGHPLADYLDHAEMRAMIDDLLLPGIDQRGWLDAGQVRSQWHAIRNRQKHANHHLFWNCLTLELWAQLFIDRRATT